MLASFRRTLGSLVVLPAAVLLLGSAWTWERPLQTELRLHEAGESARPILLHPRREGARAQRGLRLEPGDHVEVRLARPVSTLRLALQADAQSGLRVLGSHDGREFHELWRVPRAPVLAGLSTRESPPLRSDRAIQTLRVEVHDEAPHAVSALRVLRAPLTFAHAALIPLLWGSWLAAFAARRWAGEAWSARVAGFLRAWERADPWLAAALVYAVVFELSTPVVVSALAAVAVAIAVLALRRAPAAAGIGIAVALLVFGHLLPTALTAALEARIAALHDDSIDHRLLPDGDEINSDGIRFRGASGSVAAEDYVVLFLGDSFTYGEKLRYEDAYPAQVEQILADGDCRERVVAVNFGWVSSSPLLSLRLLREIGRAYQPDLVVYTLDLTDFHDDLHYEVRLAEGGELELDPAEALGRLLRIRAPWLDLDARVFAEARRMLRVARDPASQPDPESLDASFVPRNRFFVANFPLRATRARIERGVMRNLAALHAHARDALGARMALVIYPRAFQYSEHEAIGSWEEHQYERLGPFSREIFRYFDAVAKDLPYETVNLLPDFEQAAGPLFFERDPHWNPAGARLAASAVARALVERDLVPCPASAVRRASSGPGAPSPSGTPD